MIENVKLHEENDIKSMKVPVSDGSFWGGIKKNGCGNSKAL